MLRTLCLAFLGASACTPRTLAVPSGTTTTTTTDAIEPVCDGHAVQVLVPDISAYGNTIGFDVDGDDVYFPVAFSSIAKVSIHGGLVHPVATVWTQFVSVSHHHLLYPVDGCNGEDGCPAIVDRDLAAGTERSYPTPGFSEAVVATPTTLFAFSENDLLRVERANGDAVDVTLPYVETTPVLLGNHAFYAAASWTAQRIDLSSNVVDTVLPTQSITAMATDGQVVVAASREAFTFVDEDANVLGTIPHADAQVRALAIDARALYWSDFDHDPALHVVRRDTYESCAVPLDARSVIALAQDDAAIYAVLNTDADGAPTPLVRIEK